MLELRWRRCWFFYFYLFILNAGVCLNQTGVIRFRLHANTGERKPICHGCESEVTVASGKKGQGAGPSPAHFNRNKLLFVLLEAKISSSRGSSFFLLCCSHGECVPIQWALSDPSEILSTNLVRHDGTLSFPGRDCDWPQRTAAKCSRDLRIGQGLILTRKIASL